MSSHDLETLDRTLGGALAFHYHRDRYALVLLALDVGAGKRVRDVKTGPLAGLLRRPVVQAVLRRLRGDVLQAEDLLAFRPESRLDYVVSFGRWGPEPGASRRHWQTSRAVRNLVVRLNFDATHDRDFRGLLRPDRWHRPGDSMHPVDASRNTLAWARIDIEERGREALIEEVQSDWVVDLDEVHAAAKEGRASSSLDWDGCEEHASERRIRVYRDHVFARHRRTWAEAVLTAALLLLVRDLRVRRVWFHTFETGNALKHIRFGLPPRSLYTELPRRFAFHPTRRIPRFLAETADPVATNVLRNRDARFHLHAWDAANVRRVAPLLDYAWRT